MTESYKIARLIYQAFVAPRPEPQDVAEFADALEIFADARGREKFVENLLLESKKTGEQRQTCDGDACPVEYPEPEPVSELDTPPEPEPHTHTHTAGTTDGEAGTPADFAGYGAGEKRTIYAELMAFIATHGLGARRKIAECSNGALTLSDVQDMTDAKRLPLSKWRVARAAMEQIRSQNDGEESI